MGGVVDFDGIAFWFGFLSVSSAVDMFQMDRILFPHPNVHMRAIFRGS